jgi:hypothetical protein
MDRYVSDSEDGPSVQLAVEHNAFPSRGYYDSHLGQVTLELQAGAKDVEE